MGELADLAVLLGIPKSGTADELRERLFVAAFLRTVLSESDDPAHYAAKYSGRTLKNFARAARTYHNLNKYGIAAGLLTWRNACRRKGQAALRECRAAAKGRAVQLSLNLH